MIASTIVFAVIGADRRLDGTGSVRPQGRVGKSAEGLPSGQTPPV
jgi:hypothetical protein